MFILPLLFCFVFGAFRIHMDSLTLTYMLAVILHVIYIRYLLIWLKWNRVQFLDIERDPVVVAQTYDRRVHRLGL